MGDIGTLVMRSSVERLRHTHRFLVSHPGTVMVRPGVIHLLERAIWRRAAFEWNGCACRRLIT